MRKSPIADIVAAGGILLFLCPAAVEAATAQSPPNPGSSNSAVLGFSMWCQEIEFLPAVRCDMRRPEDVKSYQQYRATMERFQQERDAQARREKEFTDRLQRDPTATARGGAGP
jgi:hypothetical protein